MTIRSACILIFSTYLFAACSKSDHATISNDGLYTPYKQEISPISAITKSGKIDGNKITLSSQSKDIIGNAGSIHFVGLGLDLHPLRQTNILYDSIRVANDQVASFYPNPFKIQRSFKRTNDSIFITPLNTPIGFVRFYPCCSNPTIITDSATSSRFLTIRGTVNRTGFILFHYEIFIITNSDSYGTTNANYLDLGYLLDQLRNNDTLVYVKKSTYFKRN
jgi:hypothetical protein